MPLPSLIPIPCNLCGADAAAVVCFDGDYRICRCRRCSLVYVNPQPVLAGGDDVGFYEELDIAIDDAYLRAKAPVYDQGLAVLDDCHPDRGALLDLGCGAGAFLDRARRSGWDVHGLDVSHAAVAYARDRFGLSSVRRGDLSTVELPEGTFAAVTLWNLLEHVLDPVAVLRAARRLLCPEGGTVLVRVPNMVVHDTLRKVRPLVSPVLRRMGRSFPPYLGGISPPQHLFGFTPTTLEATLEAAGFDSVRVVSAVSHSARPVLGRLAATLGDLPSAVSSRATPLGPAILALGRR